ncbi:MAG: AraC family transcriptional regulator [Lachnospiraceae bacterium]|nr:AraC family transcriptional regulator [Lachnospiraceae bacterium]
MKKHHMHDFQNYHIHHASPKEAMTLISLINYVIYGNLQSAADVPDSVLSTDTSAESEDSSNISTYVRQNYRSEAEPHLPYLYEQRMYEYVRDGDLDALEKLIADQMTISGYSHGKLAYNDLKQNEYLIVTQITLYTRAAIEGGVNPYDAYDISDLLLQKLSAKPSLENYNNVMHECNRTFTAAVKKARSIAASSMYIEKCKYFISIHLRKPFSIPDIADYVGLTPAYLGTLFRQHESCTLKHYITCERLNAAKNLLKYSDFDISSIAQSLCFQNQSHFGVLFKKETGMTPAQYRKLNKPRNFYCET